MKKLIVLLLLASPVFAAQKYSFSDPHLEDEFVNNYKEHDFPKWINASGSSETLKYLNVSTLTLNGVNLSASAPTYIVVTTSKSAVSFATTSTSYVPTPLVKNYSAHAVGNTITITFNGDIRSSNNTAGVTYVSIFKATTDLCDLGLNTRGCVYTAIDSAVSVDLPGTFSVVDISTTTNPVSYGFRIKVDAGVTGNLNNQNTFSQLIFEESGS